MMSNTYFVFCFSSYCLPYVARFSCLLPTMAYGQVFRIITRKLPRDPTFPPLIQQLCGFESVEHSPVPSEGIDFASLCNFWIGFCLIYVICLCLVRLYLQLFVRGFMSYLRYLCLFAHSGVRHTIVLCFCFVFFFCFSIFPVFHVAQSVVFCVVFYRSLFVLLLLAIVLSVRLRFTASDYPFATLNSFFPTPSLF
jgi:hypothetical protein